MIINVVQVFQGLAFYLEYERKTLVLFEKFHLSQFFLSIESSFPGAFSLRVIVFVLKV